MSPPRRSCIFAGCHSVQSNGDVCLFKFPTDYNIRDYVLATGRETGAASSDEVNMWVIIFCAHAAYMIQLFHN